MIIREATEQDFEAIWPIFHEIVDVCPFAAGGG